MKTIWKMAAVLLAGMCVSLEVAAADQGSESATAETTPETTEATTEAITETTTEAVTDDATATAQQFFSRGKELFEAGEFAAAVESFEKAWTLKPHPAVLTNIGLCYENMGDLARAYSVYTDCIENDVGYKVPAWLKQRMGKLREKVAMLTVECPREGCRILVDGMPQQNTSATLVLMPGEHVAAAYDGEREIACVSRYLRAGETSHILLVASDTSPDDTAKQEVLPDESSPADRLPDATIKATDGATDSNPRSVISNLFWVTAGVTVVAGIGTVAFGVKTLQDKDEYDSSPVPDADIKDAGERHRMLTNVMLSVTIVAAGATAILGVAGLRKKRAKTSAVNVRVLGAGPFLNIEGNF